MIHLYNGFHPSLKDVSISAWYLSNTMAYSIDLLHVQEDMIIISLKKVPDNEEQAGDKALQHLDPVYMAGYLLPNS